MAYFFPYGLMLAIFVLALAIAFLVKVSAHIENKKKQRKQIAFIANYTFPNQVLTVFARENRSISPEQRKKAFEALREYFLLHATGRDRLFLGMPSKLADEAWHAFMLCTRPYMQFCQEAFGDYLHHTPDADAVPQRMTPDSTFGRPVTATWRAWREAKTNYPDIFPGDLPLLFTLDAAVGTGWVYTPDALVKLDHVSRRPAAGDSGSSCGGFLPTTFGDSHPATVGHGSHATTGHTPSGEASPHTTSGDVGGHGGGHSCGGGGGHSCSGSSCGGGGQ